MSTQQNARTPGDFIRAVQAKLKVKFIFDLACTYSDCIVDKSGYPYPHGYYFDQGIDALKQDWQNLPQGRVLPDGTEEAGYFNPPWKSIWEWSHKARLYSEGTYTESTGSAVPRTCNPHGTSSDDYMWEPPPLRLISLFPHGTSSQWRAHHVQGKGDIYNLAPRVPYLNPETGDYYRDANGKPKCSQTDAILVDWAGTGETYSWNWKKTLDSLPKEG